MVVIAYLQYYLTGLRPANCVFMKWFENALFFILFLWSNSSLSEMLLYGHLLFHEQFLRLNE